MCYCRENPESHWVPDKINEQDLYLWFTTIDPKYLGVTNRITEILLESPWKRVTLSISEVTEVPITTINVVL